MPVTSFKFVSPGVFINEIDNSVIELPVQNVLINLVPGFSKKGPERSGRRNPDKRTRRCPRHRSNRNNRQTAARRPRTDGRSALALWLPDVLGRYRTFRQHGSERLRHGLPA